MFESERAQVERSMTRKEMREGVRPRFLSAGVCVATKRESPHSESGT